MPKIPTSWPAAALPRLMDLQSAAFYVGLSPNTFLCRVRAGLYPQPKEDGKRRLWDRVKLDAIIDARPKASGPAGDFVDPDEEARALAAL